MPARNPVNSAIFDLVTTIIPDPGLGNPISWACPANARIEILYLGFILATDANAANRIVYVGATTPALGQIMGASSIAQTAGLTRGYSFVAGLPQEVDLSAHGFILCPMSPNLILEPGDDFDTDVFNIQATDNLASIITRYRQWIIA